MAKFVPRKVRNRPRGAAWVRGLRQEGRQRRRSEAIRTLWYALGIPIPRGRYTLPVAVGVIFGAGIAIGIAFAYLTQPRQPAMLVASAPVAQSASEPVLLRPPPPSLTPPSAQELPARVEVLEPQPKSLTMAALQADSDMAPERGEETLSDSYPPPDFVLPPSVVTTPQVIDEKPAEAPPQVVEPPQTQAMVPPQSMEPSQAMAPPQAAELPQAVEPPAPMPMPAPMPIPEARPRSRPKPTLSLAPSAQAAILPDAGMGKDPPWRHYAVPAAAMDGRPRIAVVIDDLGLDHNRSTQIVRLPGPLTTSFLTYAHDLREQTHNAKAAGHELLIHVPMEPKNQALDPGPDVLMTRQSDEHLHQLLGDIFTRFDSYVGINNHMGSQFTSDARGMAVVMQELKHRGLLFLDSRTAGNSIGVESAPRYAVPVAARDVFLDNESSVPYVNARLADVERIARERGTAVAIGHPRDATIAALAAWLPTLQQKGMVLVPLSSIVRQRTGATDKVAGNGQP
ncbi:MAG: divergent polysaccharide deacetylase family protein [Alphaproteobacteria bacterium]|nr:divergent polysaccharide deacetylase family protein [Alphaproteobacteria bacterium]